MADKGSSLSYTVHSLPPELLAEVFVILADCDLPSSRSLGYVRLSHVCARWRNVILDLIPLWSKILAAFPTSDAALITILERAGPVAPLTFWPSAWRIDSSVSSDRHLSESARELVRKEIHRTAALAHASVDDAEDWASLLGGQTLPHLSALDLISAASNIRLDFPAFRAPKLRSLVFQDLFVPFHAPSLRSLSLWMGCDADARHCIPLSELLAVLEPCQELEELDLNQAAHAGAQPVPSDTLISLPNLTTLRFRGADHIFSSLWTHLSAPACEHLHLVLPFAAHSLPNIRLIRSLLQHPSHDTLQISLSPLNLPIVQFELFVGSSTAKYESFSGRCKGRGVSLLLEHKTRSYLDNEPLHADITRTAALESVVSQLDNRHIRTVDLSSAHLSVVGLNEHDPLNTALVPLTQVDTLVLSATDNDVSDVARLRRLCEVHNREAPFSKLSTIAFKHHPSRPISSAKEWLGHNRAPLREYLASRKAAGHALAHIATADPSSCQDDPGFARFRAEVAKDVEDLLVPRMTPLFGFGLASGGSALLRRPARVFGYLLYCRVCRTIHVCLTILPTYLACPRTLVFRCRLPHCSDILCFPADQECELQCTIVR
ncbi:hypothetical protein PENSPDRAFT_147188 [Peniophora sp. CONT]|nr:hypothetical protein PENSPDRAFT_147188 [Peniophora sp. CONT]